jgi:twitching motility protein PilT
MAGVLRGVVSQRLLPRAGGGRVAAVEVMVTNARIADLIREARADEITDAIADGEFFKMQTLEQALLDLVATGAVDTETGANAAPNRHDFLVALDRELKRRAAPADVEPMAAPAAPEEAPAEPMLRLAGSQGT